MPYRVDIASPPSDVLEVLVQLGALDIEQVNQGVAAILPDGVTHDRLADGLGGAGVAISEAVMRDNGSVWILHPRAVRIGRVLIDSADSPSSPKALRLTDSCAFGTGHHPTTALCMEALDEILSVERVDSVLDVGTGSGILALAALMMGVPHAVGLDIDADALKIAAENAHRNNFADRLQLILGGPDVVEGNWPLVVANLLAAPLIDLAPVLVRRVGRGGRLLLSGIPWSLESEVRQAYQYLGMRPISSRTRAGWTLVIAQASW